MSNGILRISDIINIVAGLQMELYNYIHLSKQDVWAEESHVKDFFFSGQVGMVFFLDHQMGIHYYIFGIRKSYHIQ